MRVQNTEGAQDSKVAWRADHEVSPASSHGRSGFPGRRCTNILRHQRGHVMATWAACVGMPRQYVDVVSPPENWRAPARELGWLRSKPTRSWQLYLLQQLLLLLRVSKTRCPPVIDDATDTTSNMREFPETQTDAHVKQCSESLDVIFDHMKNIDEKAALLSR